MNLKEYAKKYIARYRLDDPKHGPYLGTVAKQVLQVIDPTEEQYKQNRYIHVFTEMLMAILSGYDSHDDEDPIWKSYRESAEGKKEEPK